MRISVLVISVSWIALHAGTSGAAANYTVVTPEYVTALSEELRQRHPMIGAAEARTNAAGAAVDAVRTWEDPMVMMGGMAAPGMMRSEEGDLIYGVEQPLPLFGKPGLERKVMRAEFGAQSANLEFTFQELRSDLAQTLFETALASENIRIAEQDLAWLDTMALTMESRYRANRSTLSQVLQVQNERARRANELQTLKQRLEQQEFVLNRMLNRPPGAKWPVLRLPELAPPVAYNQKLIELAYRYEPRIQVLKQEIRQSGASVELARRNRLPEVSVGLEGRNYSGDGEFRQGMATVKMNLPWFNRSKYKHDVKREQALKRARELELEDYQLELAAEVHDLTVKIDSARREALLYRDQIIPRSETALASARSAWETGSGELRDFLEARRMLLESRLMLAKALSEQYVMLSELVLCCGLGDLEALFMIGASLAEPTPTAKPTTKP